MRIVITNERLSQRAGTDLFLRDLARALQQLGHFVIAYSADPRERERLLEVDGIAVATDLTRLPFRPDIIHARHHFDAMTALVALPGVPAVHHCVGPAASHVLPVHPRLHRYLAPSPAVAQWIEGAGSVAGDRIAIVPSAVDPSRFSLARPAGVRTGKVLIYDDEAIPGAPAVAAMEQAARQLGLAIDLIGAKCGRLVDNPEFRLLDYDIVCATGRHAAEALASGCSVLAVDLPGNRGEIVDADNLVALHGSDFVPALDAMPLTADHVRDAFDSLGHGRPPALTAEARAILSWSRHVSEIVAAYRSAILLQARSTEDFDLEQRAMSQYLQQLSRILKSVDDRIARAALPVSSVFRLLDASAKLAAIQADLDKPRF